VLLALQPGKVVAEQAAKGGLTVLESSLLGAIVVLCLGVAILSVWKLIKVQDARIEDRERERQGRDKIQAELIALNERMIETFTALKASIDKLRESERDGQEMLRGVRQSLDSVVLEAVRRRGDRQ